MLEKAVPSTANHPLWHPLSQYLVFLTWTEPVDFLEGWRYEKAKGLETGLMQSASRCERYFSGLESLASIQKEFWVEKSHYQAQKVCSFYSLWFETFPEKERDRDRDRENREVERGWREKSIMLFYSLIQNWLNFHQNWSRQSFGKHLKLWRRL